MYVSFQILPARNSSWWGTHIQRWHRTRCYPFSECGCCVRSANSAFTSKHWHRWLQIQKLELSQMTTSWFVPFFRRYCNKRCHHKCSHYLFSVCASMEERQPLPKNRRPASKMSMTIWNSDVSHWPKTKRKPKANPNIFAWNDLQAKENTLNYIHTERSM